MMIYLQMKTIKLNLKGILGIITLCMVSLLVGVAYADENPYTLAFNTNAPIKITRYQTQCIMSSLMVNGRLGQNGS